MGSGEELIAQYMVSGRVSGCGEGGVGGVRGRVREEWEGCVRGEGGVGGVRGEVSGRDGWEG